MRRIYPAILASAVLLLTHANASTYQTILPTTTLAIETGNNAAAANSFPGCEVTTVTNHQCVDNGNLASTNVSKVNVHTMLAAGQQGAKVYTTYIPYWGNTSHPNIGYSSQDPNQVAKEIADLTSRGFDGVLVDWYGPGSWEEGATEVLKPQIETSLLTFALMIDQGAVKWHSCYPGCSATTALLNVISFARSKGYFSSPAAIRDNSGKTIVTQFGMEAYSITWSTILSANPDLHWIFENAGSFTNSYTVGAYGWLSPKNPLQNGYEGIDYTQYFERIAGQNPSKFNWASTWKGFNDVVASWAPLGGRHIQQLCGRTWLDSWAAVRAYTGRLDAVQVVTWHDYEEGTELQSGIDNCLSITASVTNSLLSWQVADASTLDHYTAYISVDGQNLMSLGDYPIGTNALDLSVFNFAPGTYQVFVKAVGKPSVRNHMSSAASYSVQLALPVVTISRPTNNSTTGQAVTIAGQGSSPNGAITQYSIYLDSRLIMMLMGAPNFQYSMLTTMGPHVVSVTAKDVAGQTATANANFTRTY